MDRKKELKRQYLQMRPTMGVFTISNTVTGEVYLEATKDLKSRMNSTPFKLNAGSHPSRPLRKTVENTERTIQNGSPRHPGIRQRRGEKGLL